MRKIIIVDDNLEFSRCLLNYISERINKVQTYQIFINGEEILDNIKEIDNNDIILLDLEIPKIDGIKLINILRKKRNKCPYIIVISGNSKLLEELKEYNNYVYRVLEKPFTMNRLIDDINEIISQIKIDDLEIKVRNELSLFNFNKSAMGYIYLIECIKLAVSNGELLKDIKNNLYYEVSKQYSNNNVLKIKWSIEKCIDGLYKNTNINILNNYFYIGVHQKLTPKIFITTVVNKLKYNL